MTSKAPFGHRPRSRPTQQPAAPPPKPAAPPPLPEAAPQPAAAVAPVSVRPAVPEAVSTNAGAGAPTVNMTAGQMPPTGSPAADKPGTAEADIPVGQKITLNNPDAGEGTPPAGPAPGSAAPTPENTADDKPSSDDTNLYIDCGGQASKVEAYAAKVSDYAKELEGLIEKRPTDKVSSTAKGWRASRKPKPAPQPQQDAEKDKPSGNDVKIFVSMGVQWGSKVEAYAAKDPTFAAELEQIIDTSTNVSPFAKAWREARESRAPKDEVPSTAASIMAYVEVGTHQAKIEKLAADNPKFATALENVIQVRVDAYKPVHSSAKAWYDARKAKAREDEVDVDLEDPKHTADRPSMTPRQKLLEDARRDPSRIPPKPGNTGAAKRSDDRLDIAFDNDSLSKAPPAPKGRRFEPLAPAKGTDTPRTRGIKIACVVIGIALVIGGIVILNSPVPARTPKTVASAAPPASSALVSACEPTTSEITKKFGQNDPEAFDYATALKTAHNTDIKLNCEGGRLKASSKKPGTFDVSLCCVER